MDAIAFSYGNTYGKGSAIYDAVSRGAWGDAAAATLIPNYANYGGAGWGTTQNAGPYSPLAGQDTRLEHGSYSHDKALDDKNITAGQAHLNWIRDVWTGPGKEPGALGQVYKAMGLIPFGAAGVIQR